MLKSVSSTDAANLLGSIFSWFSAEVHNSTFNRCCGRNLGCAKRGKKGASTERRVHFTSGRYLQLLTNNHLSRELETLLVGVLRRRVRQAAVVGSQIRLTRYFHDFELASQQHQKLPKLLKYYISRAET